MSDPRQDEYEDSEAARYDADEAAWDDEQERREVIALRKRVDHLEKALRDLYGLVDSGWLVRDISRDHEEGWGLKQLRPVMILKEVAALVGDAAALRAEGEKTP